MRAIEAAVALLRAFCADERGEGLFGGSAPTPPPLKPPPTMPDPQSPDVLAAGRRTAAAAMASGGRDSTVLTTAQNRPTLAGGAYASKVVGG